MADPLRPAPSLLAKLGSIAVHAQEYVSSDGHPVDLAAMRELLSNADVVEWFEGMRELALLPVKRK